MSIFRKFRRWRRNVEGIEDLAAGLARVESELAVLQRLCMLREISPEALARFVGADEYDFSEFGIGNPLCPFEGDPANVPLRDRMLDLRFSLTLAGLSNTQRLLDGEKLIGDALAIISKIMDPRILSVAYCRLLAAVGTPSAYPLLERIADRLEKVQPFALAGEPTLSARLIAIRLLQGDRPAAERLLKTHLDLFGTARLDCFFPVAALAVASGCHGDRLERAARLFAAMERGMREGAFEKLLRGRRVAVVGNGPQERGSGNGQRIDGYEEVVRFNDFVLSPTAAQDYGTRTTIWSRNGFASKRHVPGVKLHVNRVNPYLMDMAAKIDEYSRYLNEGAEFVWFPDEFYREICDAHGIVAPTGGFEIAWWLKKVNPEFSASDCFGFSFKEKRREDALRGFCDHYYPQREVRGGHSAADEYRVLRDLFGMEEP